MGNFFNFFKKKSKKEQQRIEDQIILGINAENLERHSDAGREFLVAYSGYDATTNTHLKKSLLGISSSKPNMPGQRGYAAEVCDVATRNKEEILKGSNMRYSRVDDLPGHSVNETPFDIMAVDSSGNEISSLGSQMKFNQGNPKSVADTLLGKNFREKYPHAQYSVPADRYDEIKQEISKKVVSLEKQLKTAKNNNNTQLIDSLKERLKYAKDAEKKLVKSKITLAQAEKAVSNPKGIMTKEVLQLGNDAGIQYAMSAATIKGSMTFATKLNKYLKGEISFKEALSETFVDTAKGATIGYITGQTNTIFAATLRNSSKEALRKLGSSSAPAQIVTFATNVFKIINDRMEGKITEEECFHNIAKSGIGVVGTFKAGAIGGKIGATLGGFGGPVGSIVGSVVAGVIIDSTYDYAVKTLKAPGIAKQERLQIEKECEELHLQLEQYRENFRKTYIAHTNELINIFGNSLKDMALAINMNDANSFIMGANTITEALGETTQFNTVDEFEKFLNSDYTFNL